MAPSAPMSGVFVSSSTSQLGCRSDPGAAGAINGSEAGIPRPLGTRGGTRKENGSSPRPSGRKGGSVVTLAQRHGGSAAYPQASSRQAPWAAVSVHRPTTAGSVGNVPSMATPRSSSPVGLVCTPKGQQRSLTNKGTSRQQMPPSFEMRCRSLAANAHAAIGAAAAEVVVAADAAGQACQEELQDQEQRQFKDEFQEEEHQFGDRDNAEEGMVVTEKAQMAVETLSAVDRALQSARDALETARRTRGLRSARTVGPAPSQCGSPLAQRGCSTRVAGARANKPREVQLPSAPRPMLPDGFATRGASPGLSLQSAAPLFSGGSPLSRSSVGVPRSSFMTPDASPSRASSARSPCSLAAARTSHKEQVGAVENSRAFTVSLLRKLDELHEQNLEARICSLQMGSRRTARGAGAASEQFADAR